MKTPRRTLILLLFLVAGVLATFRSIGQTPAPTPAPQKAKLHLIIHDMWAVKNTTDFENTLTQVDPLGGNGSQIHFKKDDGSESDWPHRNAAINGPKLSETGGPGSIKPATVHVTQQIYTTNAADLEKVVSQLQD